jgi:hypothetical protein
MYILVSGFGGLMSGMAALLVFRLMGTYTTPDYRWFVLYVSTGVFTFIGFLNALQVLGFFPWLSRVLISSLEVCQEPCGVSYFDKVKLKR